MPPLKYRADGLTIDWCQTVTLPEWWATNPAGKQGFSYCVINARHEGHIARLSEQLRELTTAPYEILTFPEDLSMSALKPRCKYSWVMQIDDNPPTAASPEYSPKISIIVPTYKRQHVIGRTVDSLLAQEYTNWELIVVNNEPGAVHSFSDSRIAVYDHYSEANACFARNSGLMHATGEIVCFFDDDDVMLPGYLRKMSAPFADPNVRVTRCGMLCGFGACDFSYSTQEAWLRREDATPTWAKGSLVHDQIYYRTIVEKKGWTRNNIIQLGEVLVRATSDPVGGIRAGGF